MSVLQTAYDACPLCTGKSIFIGATDSTGHALWHEGLPPTVEWMRCTHCAHVHTRGYWTEAGLAQVFRFTHSNQQAAASDYPDAKRATWAGVVDRAIGALGGYCSLFGHRNPSWVDVGCGDGALLMTASDFGFDALGLDARADTVASIQKLGFNAHRAEFSSARFDGQADVLSMMDVLEHMPYPREALRKAASVLHPHGLIVISLPDSNCSSWRVMDAANSNPYWREIEHHHNFSRQRLMALLDECGFDVVDFAIPLQYKAQMELYARPKRSAA